MDSGHGEHVWDLPASPEAPRSLASARRDRAPAPGYARPGSCPRGVPWSAARAPPPGPLRGGSGPSARRGRAGTRAPGAAAFGSVSSAVPTLPEAESSRRPHRRLPHVRGPPAPAPRGGTHAPPVSLGPGRVEPTAPRAHAVPAALGHARPSLQLLRGARGGLGRVSPARKQAAPSPRSAEKGRLSRAGGAQHCGLVPPGGPRPGRGRGPCTPARPPARGNEAGAPPAGASPRRGPLAAPASAFQPPRPSPRSPRCFGRGRPSGTPPAQSPHLLPLLARSCPAFPPRTFPPPGSQPQFPPFPRPPPGGGGARAREAGDRAGRGACGARRRRWPGQSGTCWRPASPTGVTRGRPASAPRAPPAPPAPSPAAGAFGREERRGFPGRPGGSGAGRVGVPRGPGGPSEGGGSAPRAPG